MRSLLIVDVQNDFCPGGALPAPGGDRVVPVINSLMGCFSLIIASKDWHPVSTVHFDKWPAHCVQGTRGAEFHQGLRAELITRTALKGTRDRDEGYSAFEATNLDLEEVLKSSGVDSVYVTGIATEYCVRETAQDAVRRGFRTFVVREAVAGIELKEGDVERAFQAMQKEGVEIISSKDVPGEV